MLVINQIVDVEHHGSIPHLLAGDEKLCRLRWSGIFADPDKTDGAGGAHLLLHWLLPCAEISYADADG
jgi:hypothetical protein